MKQISIITFLIITNIISAFLATVFFFEMRKNLDDLDSESRHFIEHAQFDLARFKQYLKKENSNITMEKFINKHSIKSIDMHKNDEIVFIYVDTLTFTFKNGKFIDVQ